MSTPANAPLSDVQLAEALYEHAWDVNRELLGYSTNPHFHDGTNEMRQTWILVAQHARKLLQTQTACRCACQGKPAEGKAE